MDQTTKQVNSIRKTPLVLQAIFLEILRGHFSRNSPQFQYSPDSRLTGLIIEPAFNWNAEEVQKRPAVYVKRGAFQYNRIAIDDRRAQDVANGTTSYTMLADAAVTCMCISKAPGEAERLAEEVSEILIAFKKAIREDFAFLKFNVASINELGILEESQEFFACPVITLVQFEESWCVTLAGLKLQEILLNVHHKITECADEVLFGKGKYGEGPYDGGGTSCITEQPGTAVTETINEGACCPPELPKSG